MTSKTEPSWAWSSIDDPNPIYPKCDHCSAFARWAIANLEDSEPAYPYDDPWTPIVRWFACGTHINRALMTGSWRMDEVHIYDITEPPEPS